MGWLPSAPQLGVTRSLSLAKPTRPDYPRFTAQALKSGSIRFACEQPDNGSNHPRNLFIWRSNLLGSSGKGHEYMLKYLLGTENGIQGRNSVPATGSNRKKSSGKLRRLKASSTCW